MKNYNIIDEVLSVNEFAWSLYNSNPLNQRKNNMGTPEVKLLLENLHKKNVKYLLIGGFAMAFHGYVRATNDIDLWIKNTPQNMDALRQALIETGIKEAAFMKSTTQLLGGFTMFNLLESDFKIDLLQNLKLFKEVDFDLCYSKATISDYAGIQIPVIHAEDLLAEKKAAARQKDLADISFLEEIAKRLGFKK